MRFKFCATGAGAHLGGDVVLVLVVSEGAHGGDAVRAGKRTPFLLGAPEEEIRNRFMINQVPYAN